MALALLAWKSLPFFTATARRLRRNGRAASAAPAQHPAAPAFPPNGSEAAAATGPQAPADLPGIQARLLPLPAPSVTVIPLAPIAVPAPAPKRRSGVPLRVISRRHGDGSCRLLISGRMADVCAELDRLVLQ